MSSNRKMVDAYIWWIRKPISWYTKSNSPFYFSRNGGKSPLHTLLLTWMIVLICQVGMAQDHSDVDRIKSAHYMHGAHKSDCDSLDGNNAQLKICLNFEFQQVDSILNERFIRYLNEIQNDSIKKSIVQFQHAWVLNRRSVSSLESEGYVGHWMSISFLSSMVFITRKRIEELEYLIKYK